MDFKPSNEQNAIFDCIMNETCNIGIEAAAGSGKTTTIVKAIDHLDFDDTVAFFAFNKSIANELKIRINNSEVDICTNHSLGFKLINRYYRSVKLNEAVHYFRIKALVSRHVDLSEKKNKKYYERINALVTLYKLYRCNMVKSTEDIWNLVDHHGLMVADLEMKWFLEYVEEVKDYYFNASKIDIDFTDMIYLPHLLELSYPQYDYVFVDEAQDLNRCQQLSVMKSCSQYGRIIFVGDRMQAIYGFTGADSQSFQTLIDESQAKLFPLNTSYRCAKKVIEKAQRLNPKIQFFDKNPDGEIKEETFIDDLQPRDFVLCRNTQPLLELFWSLVEHEMPCYIKGQDIGDNIVKIIRNMSNMPADIVISILREKENEAIKLLEERGVTNYKNHPTYQKKKDDRVIIQKLVNKYHTIDKVIEKVEEIFKDEGEGIVLSTIHKSKGLESDRVFFLKPELLPSQYAIKDWQIQQEKNLEYVMITRAKNFIGYLQPYKK